MWGVCCVLYMCLCECSVCGVCVCCVVLISGVC